MKNRLVWHADFALDTNAVSRATEESEYRKLANLIRRMTAREEYGKAWLPVTSFIELLSGNDSAKRTVLLRTFRRLHQDVLHGVKILPPLPVVIEGEWKEPPESREVQSTKLESEVERALASGSLDGTLLEEVREEYVVWRDGYRARYQQKLSEWAQLYKVDSAFRESVREAINGFHPPAAFRACDDLAKQLLVDHGHQLRFGVGLKF